MAAMAVAAMPPPRPCRGRHSHHGHGLTPLCHRSRLNDFWVHLVTRMGWNTQFEQGGLKNQRPPGSFKQGGLKHLWFFKPGG